ncbi:hypothetical protein BJ166DRAFT_520383 [Pestalotiopsis sp. NC0098]|nr:hypothetical protein BJ166DRAFT_520383 [Pestalotiopsis sp. NC0098]
MQGCHDGERDLTDFGSFQECESWSADLPPLFRNFFESWGQHHMENPQRLSEKQLQEAVDDMVFGDWTSAYNFYAPEFEYPPIINTCVKVGKFNKDLPDPKKGQQMLVGTLEDKLFAYLAEDEHYSAPTERKAGQPAWLRTRPDGSGNTIIYDWVDDNGEWAPHSAIEFDSGEDMPFDYDFDLAYKTFDFEWSKACDEWNSSLCVYLCRKAIWDATNRTFLCPMQEHSKNYTSQHFVKAPSIRNVLANIKNNWPNELCSARYRERRGVYGQAVFRERHSP